MGVIAWRRQTGLTTIAKNFDRASKAGGRATAAEPRARKARYDAKNDRIVVELTNGCIFAFPPRLAQG